MVLRTRIGRWEWVCLWPVCSSVALSLFSFRSQQRLFGKFQAGSAVRRTGSVRSLNLSRYLLSERRVSMAGGSGRQTKGKEPRGW